MVKMTLGKLLVLEQETSEFTASLVCSVVDDEQPMAEGKGMKEKHFRNTVKTCI